MSTHSLRHIGIIMDGNNRWAKQRGMPGPAGHKAGVERIRDVMKACRRHGVEVLTLFAFSSENWRRPEKEVDALMALFLSYLKREARRLRKEGVRLRVIGNRTRFSARILSAIETAEAMTCHGDTHLVIAADYGGRWDIANAAQRMARQVAAGELRPEQIDEARLHDHTALADLPALDMLIRTGGELRISNFLLWQSAYAELHFSDLFWPDFDEAALDLAVEDFYRRQRRFGLSGDQVVDQPRAGRDAEQAVARFSQTPSLSQESTFLSQESTFSQGASFSHEKSAHGRLADIGVDRDGHNVTKNVVSNKVVRKGGTGA